MSIETMCKIECEQRTSFKCNKLEIAYCQEGSTETTKWGRDIHGEHKRSQTGSGGALKDARLSSSLRLWLRTTLCSVHDCNSHITGPCYDSLQESVNGLDAVEASFERLRHGEQRHGKTFNYDDPAITYVFGSSFRLLTSKKSHKNATANAIGQTINIKRMSQKMDIKRFGQRPAIFRVIYCF